MKSQRVRNDGVTFDYLFFFFPLFFFREATSGAFNHIFVEFFLT